MHCDIALMMFSTTRKLIAGEGEVEDVSVASPSREPKWIDEQILMIYEVSADE